MCNTTYIALGRGIVRATLREFVILNGYDLLAVELVEQAQ